MKLCMHLAIACVLLFGGLPSPQAAAQPLTLEQALSLARTHNPTLPQFNANLEIARAAILTARAYPNPELELGIGSARSREAGGGSEAEYSIGIVQPLELPGKRNTRRAAAEAALPVIREEAAGFRARLRAETAKAYATLVYRQHALALAETDASLAGELLALVERRVEGGESAEIDRVKTRLETLKAQRRVQVARRDLNAARIALNALCGGSLPAEPQLVDDLPASLTAVDAGPALLTMQAGHPEFARLDAEAARRAAVLLRERKVWLPDLRPGLSTAREMDADSFAVTLGFEIPLWNRNEGGIAEARQQLSALEVERNIALAELQRELDLALQAQAGAAEQLAAFGADLRTGAAEALRIETFLYEQGEHDLLQLLDARRTAQETEAEYLQARYDAGIAQIELEQAIGIGSEE